MSAKRLFSPKGVKSSWLTPFGPSSVPRDFCLTFFPRISGSKGPSDRLASTVATPEVALVDSRRRVHEGGVGLIRVDTGWTGGNC